MPQLTAAQFARNLTAASGLISENNHHVLEDSRGFIWIASDAGVHRFDGIEFEIFTTDEGLGSNEIFYIAEDGYRRIWFLSYDGTVSYYLNGKFYNPNNTPFLREAQSRTMHTHVYVDSRDRLWIGVDAPELFMIDYETVHHFVVQPQFGVRGRAIWEQNGQIYYLYGQSIFEIDNALQITKFAHFPEQIEHYSKSYSGENHYLASTISSIVDLRTLETIISFENAGRPVQFTSSVLLKNGQLWAGTSNDGLFIFDTTQNNRLVNHYLPGSFIGRVYLDSQDNIWVSTLNKGVHFYPNVYSHIRQYNENNDLPSSNILSLAAFSEDEVLVGDDLGNVFRIDAERIVQLVAPNNLTVRNRIDRIFQIAERDFVFSSAQNTHLYRNGYLFEVKLAGAESLEVISAVKSFYLEESTLFLAGSHGVYVMDIHSDRAICSFLLAGRFSSISKIGSNIYLGSNSGLWIYNVESQDFIHFTDIPELNTIIYDIKPKNNRYLLFATYKYGIVEKDLETQNYRVINRVSGLSSNLTRQIHSVNENSHWVSTSAGLNHLTFDDENKVHVTNYSQAHGILSTNITDVVQTNGELWVAGNRGLSRLPLPLEPETQRTIPLNVRFLAVNNEKFVTDFSSLVFQPNQNNIDIAYSGIFHAFPELIQYRYRFSEQQNWSEAPSRLLSFRELGFGKYTLYMQAFSEVLGIESEIVQLNFIIRPTLFESPLFRTLLASFMMIGIAAFVVISNRFVRKREQEKLRQLKAITELKHQALSSMMNPHFIFNALSSIRYFILTKSQDEASKYLVNFSRLIRLQLNSSFQERSTLADELERIKLYIRIEKNRLEHNISYEVAIDEDIEPEEIRIPSLLLQPFIENAIWHGIQPAQRDGSIAITIRPFDDQSIEITITDDGLGINASLQSKRADVEKEHQSLATKLIRRRLELLSEEKNVPYQITYTDRSDEDSALSGTLIRLVIPV